jgi:iron complex transport system ATP-binding protein
MTGREDLLHTLEALTDRPSVIVSHHLEDIPRTTTHALLLHDGRAIAQGEIESVLSPANLARTFGLEVTVHRHAGRWQAVRT